MQKENKENVDIILEMEDLILELEDNYSQLQLIRETKFALQFMSEIQVFEEKFNAV
jgi:hypothetical protein